MSEITWDKPWNLLYFEHSSVKYELAIQPKTTDVAKVVFVNQLIYRTLDVDCYVWIRCHFDSQKGPYQKEPISC
jgi:hypothetical protein